MDPVRAFKSSQGPVVAEEAQTAEPLGTAAAGHLGAAPALGRGESAPARGSGSVNSLIWKKRMPRP